MEEKVDIKPTILFDLLGSLGFQQNMNAVITKNHSFQLN